MASDEAIWGWSKQPESGSCCFGYLGEPSRVNMILGAEMAFGVACAAIFALAVTGRSNLSDWEVGNLNKIAVLTGTGAVAMAALIALRLY